ncbi:MAG: hypothetical protein K8W52_28495 [Deltaproteobacteria bacterium]|nr:hypothetical protein [Deltaproteobacteria bacterium]
MRNSLLKKSAALGLLAVWATSAFSAPASITSVAAPPPANESTAPKAGAENDLVSNSGEASYRIPIVAPPGRNGAAPNLALVYGSRAPLRGGIAAGWSLPLGEITVDTSRGWAGGIGYAIGGERLIPVSEPQRFANVTTYRLHGDTSYSRFEHVADGTEEGFWRVRHLDGSITEYGSTPNSRDQRLELDGIFGGQGRWMLSRTVDAHGNEVVYDYETVFGFAHDEPHAGGARAIDRRIKMISYGRNVNVPGSTHHAMVTFDYAPDLEYCTGSNVPVGAQFSFRTGIRVYEGASKLNAIRGYVKNGPTWVNRTKLDLTYDASKAACGQPHAPLRVLTSVKRSAWNEAGTLVELPPVTMEYGPMDYVFESTGSTNGRIFASGTSTHNVDTNGFPTTQVATADVDGDGILDDVGDGYGPGCGPGSSIPGASFPWAGNAAQPAVGVNVPLYKRETCASTMQVVHRGKLTNVPQATEGSRQINNFRMIDVTGDGLPDLVTQLSYNADGYDPKNDTSINVPTANVGPTAYPACSALPPPPCHEWGNPEGCIVDNSQTMPLGRPTWVADPDYHPTTLTPLVDTGTGGPTMSTTDGVCPDDTVIDTSTCDIGLRQGCPCVAMPGSSSSPVPSDDPDRSNSGLDTPMTPEFWGGAGGSKYVGNPNGDGGSHQASTNAMIPDMHCGYYVLRVYQNLGTGAADGCSTPSGVSYACAPTIVYSPIPMEAVAYASRADSGPLANASTWTAFSDIDGDGHLDAIWQYPVFGDGPWDFDHVDVTRNFSVWRGTLAGSFEGKPSGGAYSWTTPPALGRSGINARDSRPYQDAAHARIYTGSTTSYNDGDHQLRNEHMVTESTSTLHDVNGDGLPDLVISPTNPGRNLPGAVVYFNTGNGFDPTATSLDVPDRAALPSDAPFAESISRTVTVPFLSNEKGDLDEGYTVATRRLVDIDGDGLEDIASMPLPASGGSRDGVVPGQRTPLTPGDVWVLVNMGDKLIPTKLSATAKENWYHSLLSITAHLPNMIWNTTTDVRDDDGDGLPETQVVTPGLTACTYPDFDCSQIAEGRRAQRLPYRLLTKVDNGLGQVTSFAYASVRDSAVVTRTDTAHRVASPLLVVKQVDVVTDGVSGTASTKYLYKNPVTNQDDFGRPGFRGFEEMRVLSPEVQPGVFATNVRRFDFTLDKLGRQVRQLAYDQSKLISMVDSSYAVRSTFNGSVRAVQLVETRSYTCTPSAAVTAENDCLLAPSARTTTTWSSLKESSATASTLAGNETAPEMPASVDTPSSSCQTITCDGNDLPASGDGAPLPPPILAWVPTAQQRSTSTSTTTRGDRLDSTMYGFRYEAGKYMTLVIGQDSTEATTDGTFTGGRLLASSATTYDAGDHGLPVSTRKQRNPGEFSIARWTYDPYFNIKSATRPTQFVIGGPAKVLTYDDNGLYPIDEEDETHLHTGHTWDIGLGLATEERAPAQGSLTPWTRTKYDGFGRVLQVSRSKVSGSGLVDLVTKSVKYSDKPGLQHTVQEFTTIDESAPLGKYVRRFYDGAGRVLEEDAFTSPTAQTRTFWRYDLAGNLATVYLPNPLGVSPESQIYSTRFDTLHRVIRMDSPGAAPRFQTYQGLVTTITEVPSDGSVPSKKVLQNDSFGRLVKVIEGTTHPATTTYAYDALDRMTHIVDADGVPTDIGYNLAGLRSSVSRNSRALSYDYDEDGNRIAAHHPTPMGVAPDDGHYTSFWSYDVLGRLRVSTPAIRDQASNVARYGLVATMYNYGEAGRAFGTGRLTSVVTGAGTTTYDYTIEGFVASEARNLSVAPDGVAMSSNATTSTTYNVAGQPVLVVHPDDPTAPTKTRYTYDALGRLASAEVLTAAGTWQPLAVLTRNKAGLVTTRYSTSPGAVEQAFTYDAAGRVISHQISGLASVGGATTTLGGESLVFTQDGNVKSVTDLATNRQLVYTYDEFQQLASATVPGTTDYQATFQYSPAGSVKAANIQSTLAGAQVVPRNVTYDFDSTGALADPAAPLRLLASGGAVFAAMSYDASGNLTQRTKDGITMSFTYDGEDAQREAINTTTGEREVYYYDQTGQRILTYRPARDATPAHLVNRFGTTEITTDTAGGRTTTTDVVLGAYPVARIVDHNAGTVQRLYHGVLGSLLVTTDASNVLRARYGYGPYGEILYAAGPDAAAFDRTYEGKARDKLTGLSYFGARYYDPMTLSWTQADPRYRFVPDLAYSEPRRMGLYTYSLNNPLKYLDPDGRDLLDIISFFTGAQPVVPALNPDSHDTLGEALEGLADAGQDLIDQVPDAFLMALDLQAGNYDRVGVKLATKAVHQIGQACNFEAQILSDPVGTLNSLTVRDLVRYGGPMALLGILEGGGIPEVGGAGGGKRYWRGAKPGEAPQFSPRASDFKVDNATGLVKPTHGVSVFDNPQSVMQKGMVPYEVDQASIPDAVCIRQRSSDPKHFEIMPKPDANLTPADFTAACKGILCL